MVWINPGVDVAVIAFCVVAFFNMIRWKTEDRALMKTLKEKNKRVRELMKRTDKHSKKEVEKANRELIELNMRVMKKTMPITLVSLAVFMAVFPFIRAAYEPFVFPLPFPVPWIDMQFHTQTNWLGYYFLVSLTFSAAAGVIKKLVLRAGKKGD